MTSSTDPDFDPRFDPAFQRGFASDGAQAAPPAAARQPYTPRARGPVAEPASAVSPPRAPGAPMPAPETSSSVASAPLVSAPLSERTDVAADVERDRRPNPFLIVLGVLSVALIAAGVWGVQTARAPFLGTNVATDVDFVGLQILQVLAPMAIALGAATAIGILFVYAAGWQRAAGGQRRR